jgi:hypothetical protein
MVNCKKDNKGQLNIRKVVLSDLDCSLELEGEKLLHARIGNVIWRSPEAQIGKGLSKPSNIFSYRLLVS